MIKSEAWISHRFKQRRMKKEKGKARESLKAKEKAAKVDHGSNPSLRRARAKEKIIVTLEKAKEKEKQKEKEKERQQRRRKR